MKKNAAKINGPIGLWVRNGLIFLLGLYCMMIFTAPSFGQQITLVSGTVELNGGKILIRPELVIYDKFLPVGIYYLTPMLHVSGISAWEVNDGFVKEVKRYVNGGIVLLDDMQYIARQCHKHSQTWTRKSKNLLVAGKRVPFIWIKCQGQESGLLLDPLDEDNRGLATLLRCCRYPGLFNCNSVELPDSTQVLSFSIRFHEVGKLDDITSYCNVHLIRKKDLRTLGIDATYFTKTHHYEKVNEIECQMGRFTSGDYYLLGDKVFLADLTIEFKGMDTCKRIITDGIKSLLKSNNSPDTHPGRP